MDRLFYACRQAAQLTSRAMDEPLPTLQGARLALHRMMCADCRNFSRQLGILRKVSRKLPDALAQDDGDAGSTHPGAAA